MKDLLNDLLFSNDEILKEYRMKKLIRYNNRNRLADEDIAQHSYFVSLFCLKIFDRLNLDSDKKYKILVKAILHDISEIELSDIPYDVKLKHPKIKNLMNELEDKFYLENYPQYYDIINEDDRLVDSIVKLADVYSVRQYALNEITLGNNDEIIKDIYNVSFERLKEEIRKIEKEINDNE